MKGEEPSSQSFFYLRINQDAAFATGLQGKVRTFAPEIINQ